MEKVDGVSVGNLRVPNPTTTGKDSGDSKNSAAHSDSSMGRPESAVVAAPAIPSGAVGPAAASSGNAINSVELPVVPKNLRFFASGFSKVRHEDTRDANFGSGNEEAASAYKLLVQSEKVTDCFELFVDTDLEKNNKQKFNEHIENEKNSIQTNYSGYTISYDKNICPSDGSKIVAIMDMKLPVLQNYGSMTREEMLAASENPTTYQSYHRKISLFRNLSETERQILKIKIAPAMASINLPMVKFFLSGDLKN
jgi:hypothetical protein